MPENRSPPLSKGAANILFAAPALLLFATFVIVPFVSSVYLAFHEWSGFGAPNWVGIANFIRAAADITFLRSFVHVTIYVAGTLVVEVAFGLFMAMLLNSTERRYSILRTLFFSPVVLSWAAAGLIWKFLLDYRTGALNAFLRSVGLEEIALPWLSQGPTALLAITVVSGWKYAGFYMIIFFAAIRRIPRSIYEAATLDGASPLRQVFSITIPLIRGNIFMAGLLAVTGGFASFDLFFTMTNGQPNGATEVPITWIIKQGIAQGQIGYGTALTLVLVVFVVAVGTLYLHLSEKADVTRY